MKREAFYIVATPAMIARGLGADAIVAALKGVGGLKGGGKPNLAQGSYETGRWAEVESAFYLICQSKQKE